jgi:hypothetical protein
MSYQAKTQTLIKDPMEIIQGADISGTDCTLQNLVVGYETADHYSDEFIEDGGDEHHIMRLMDYCEIAFNEVIKSDMSTYSPTNASAALAMYNLGKLARETINDDTFLWTVKNFDVLLRSKIDGTEIEESGTSYAIDMTNLWYAIGQGSDDMFGSWSSTQWRPIDDALAGIWITFFYVLFHWGVQVCTYFSRDYVRGIGEYVTSGGAVEGRLKKMDIFNEADWPLRFLSIYNGVGDVFGINASMVDDPALKGIQVPIFDAVEPFIQKYFSRSRWIWRYMRWVDVSPIYTLLPPKVADKGAPAANDTYSDFDNMQLFDSDTTFDWDAWNTRLVRFTQRLQRFKFRGNNGAAFGKLKSRIKLVNIMDLPEPGIGQGGLFWHQMTSVRVDPDVGGDDNFFCFKYRPIKEGSDLDYTPALEPNVLQMRRNKDNYYWFQLIGDIDPEMFMFVLGTHITHVKQRKDVSATIFGADGTLNEVDTDTNMPTYYNIPFSPMGLVTFTVEKDEDEGYYLNYTAQSYTFDPFVISTTYTFIGKPPSIYDWECNSSGDGLYDDNSAHFTSYPNWYYSAHELNLQRDDYFDMRSSDPYKKLKHIVYDTNMLDAVAIRNVMSKTYLGTTPAEEVATSAKLGIEAISQRKDGGGVGSKHNEGSVETKISAMPDDDTVEKVDDDMEKISAKYTEKHVSAEDEETKISVSPEQVAKAEKALKVMKDQLAKDKKKEAAKKKEAKK